MFESLIVLILIVVGFGVLFYLSRKRPPGQRWGLNLKRVNCPRCGTVMPLVRKPTSVEQATWGGWTCPSCGCEMDKYGKEIAKS
jgi:hypothetical protein